MHQIFMLKQLILNKTDANNPRTWTHSGTNRVKAFSVDGNGLMHVSTVSCVA